MLILIHLNPADKRGHRAYRLQVKERLYRFNYVRSPCISVALQVLTGYIQETLMQLEKDERLQKLEETFQNVREDYQRILKSVR